MSRDAVIPAKPGIQSLIPLKKPEEGYAGEAPLWMPAYAGMTKGAGMTRRTGMTTMRDADNEDGVGGKKFTTKTTKKM